METSSCSICNLINPPIINPPLAQQLFLLRSLLKFDYESVLNSQGGVQLCVDCSALVAKAFDLEEQIRVKRLQFEEIQEKVLEKCRNNEEAHITIKQENASPWDQKDDSASSPAQSDPAGISSETDEDETETIHVKMEEYQDFVEEADPVFPGCDVPHSSGRMAFYSPRDHNLADNLLGLKPKNSRVYACGTPGCKKTFTDRKILQHHQQRCECRRYKCKWKGCDIRFATKQNAITSRNLCAEHRREKKQYKCPTPYCKKAYITEEKYVEHERKCRAFFDGLMKEGQTGS